MSETDLDALEQKALRLAEYFGSRTSAAVDRKAIEIARRASVLFEELEDHGSDGENRATYRRLAREELGLLPANPLPSPLIAIQAETKK